ncbi:MAG: response regulator [Cyanobacteria bacterium REEB67]|nr:response regulator [Cyanobacteria bacterium REEB67]
MTARILVLIEHPEPLKTMADSLELYGHRVLREKDFKGAMETLKHEDVDMIIGDVHLQNGGSIFDFMRWVKGDPHLQSIPFLCFSAEPVEVSKYLRDGVRTAARSLGAVKYITMETFMPELFRDEVEWLLPKGKVSNYYSVDKREPISK